MNIEQMGCEFVETIVKIIVNKPDDVRTESRIDEKGVFITLQVDEKDLGRVIGGGGSTVQALRTLLRCIGMKNNARYSLMVHDPNKRR